MEGKTYGRLMQKAFVLDSGWIRSLSAQDVERLRVELDLDPFVLQKIIKNGMLNIEAFRQYIYHWLMAYPRVSQQPLPCRALAGADGRGNAFAVVCISQRYDV